MLASPIWLATTDQIHPASSPVAGGGGSPEQQAASSDGPTASNLCPQAHQLQLDLDASQQALIQANLHISAMKMHLDHNPECERLQDELQTAKRRLAQLQARPHLAGAVTLALSGRQPRAIKGS